MTRFSRITGTGSYLPEQILSNKDLESMVDTSDQWIRERTGIVKRHIAVDGQTTCDLAHLAAERAIEAAGKTHADIDLIVVATTTPDKVFPSTACLIQQRLNIHGCAALMCRPYAPVLSTRSVWRTNLSAQALRNVHWWWVQRHFRA